MSYFFPTNFYDDIELIKKNYQIVKRGQVPASNVICQVVEFLPNQDNRPIREIWFEKERKLPVRTYVYTRGGRLTYISELDNIQWSPQLDKDAFQLRVPPMTTVYEITEKSNLTLEEAQKLTHVPIILPPRIPPGFHPFNILVRFEGDHRKVQMVYSDGLSSFSIFQESIPLSPNNAKDKCPVPATTQLPPQNTPFISHYGLLKVFSCDLHGMRATLVGDISENDLLDTARSFSTSK